MRVSLVEGLDSFHVIVACRRFPGVVLMTRPFDIVFESVVDKFTSQYFLNLVLAMVVYDDRWWRGYDFAGDGVLTGGVEN